MAGSISVGTVYVDVRPDLRQWTRDLRSQLLPPTAKVGDEVGETLAKPVRDKLRDSVSDGVKAGGRKSRTTAAKEGQETGSAFAKTFRNKVEAALRNLPNITVDANTTAADKRLAELRKRLADLHDAKVGVDLDAGAARAEIEDLALELRTLSREDARLDVRVDAGAAAVELEALRKQVDSLDGKTIDIPVDNNSFLSASAYQSHIRKILKGIATLAPAVTAAIAATSAGALGLVAVLGAAGGGAAAFGIALAGSVVNAGAAVKELNKLETQLDSATDSAQRFKIVGEINELMAGLSKPTKDFIVQLEELKASWQAMVTATGPQTLAVAGSALEVVQKALAPLPGLVSSITPVFARFVGTIDGWVSGSGYQTFIGFLKAEAPPALANLTALMGNLATGIGGVIAAFTPFGQQFLSVLTEGSARFATWGQQLGATSGFREFIAYVQSTGPQVFGVLRELATAIIDIGVALAPLSGPTLVILQTLAQVLQLVAGAAPGLVTAAAAIFAVGQATKTFGNLVTGAQEKVSGFVSTLSSGRGGVGGAMSGLRAGLGSLVGALGGPWGVAIAGGITALGLFANAHAKAKARQDELKQSLDQATGAITQQSKAIVAKNLVESGAVKWARELGVSLSDVQQAALGNEDAYRRVTAAAAETIAAEGDYSEVTGATNARQSELRGTLGLLTGELGRSTGAIAEQRVVIKDTSELMGGWIDQTSGLRFATKEQAKAHADAGSAIRGERNELVLLVEQMKKNRAEALGFANAEIGYEQAVDDATAAVKENGKTHDINTQKGRDNVTALLGLAAAQNKLADDVKFTSKPVAAQNKILADQRREFINAGVAMGYTKEQAAKLADQYLKTPKEVNTEAKLEAEEKKLEDWKKGIDPGIPKQANTQTSLIADNLGVGRWKGQVATIPKKQATAGSIIKDNLGLGSWKNHVETIPATKPTKGKVTPDYTGVQNAKESLNTIPRSYQVTFFVQVAGLAAAGARIALLQAQLAVLRAQTGGQDGGVVGEDIMRFARGGVVDMRRGGTQPGFSARDNRIGLFRDGEAVLVPEVTRALGGSSAIKAMNAAGSKVAEVLREVLEIHSPSKVMVDLGRWIVAGLVKGLTGSVSKVESTVKQLGDRIYKAFTKQFGFAKGKRLAGNLTRSLADETKRLTTLAKQRETVAARLKVAQDKLADAVKAREDFAKSIREETMGFGAITGLTAGNEAPTAQGLIDELKSRVEESKQYAKVLADLRKKGLNLTTYRQLVEAGVDTGGPIAQALLEGGTGAIKQINSLTSQLGLVAKNLGAQSSKELYQAGVNSAQALVRGLQSQAKALAAASKKLAAQIVKYLKRALGIKSPSTLLADQVGQFLPLGVAQGVEQHPDAITKALANQVNLVYGANALASQGIQTGEYNPGTFTKGDNQRQPMYLVLEDGTKFTAYIDNRADGRLSAAARRAKTGVKR
jgi:hypothetical protein